MFGGGNMPSVEEVRPKIWNENSIINLYDDGNYSVIWGIREESSKRSLGVRWNGDSKYPGYPNQGKNPVWYSEPEFLESAILHSLLQKVIDSNFEKKDTFISNILVALKEC